MAHTEGRTAPVDVLIASDASSGGPSVRASLGSVLKGGPAAYFRNPSLPFTLLAIGHVPFLWVYAARMWHYEHYRFLPFAVGAFSILWYLRADASRFKWSWFSSVLVVADALLVLLGALLNSPWLVVLGLFCLLLAFLWASADRSYQNHLAYLAIIPLLAIRLPLRLDQQLISWLQRITTRAASMLLHWLGCFHCREGNVIRFADERLFVEEACSGVQSLFTVLLIAAVIAVLWRRSPLHTILLLISGVLWAGLMNVMRVTVIAVAQYYWSVDLSAGLIHDLLGYVMLGAAVLLIVSTDQLLCFLFGPIHFELPDEVDVDWSDELDVEQSAPRRPNPLVRLWNRFVARPVVLQSSPDDNFPQSAEAAESTHDTRAPKPGGLRNRLAVCGVLAGIMLISQSVSLVLAHRNSPQSVLAGATPLTVLDRASLDGELVDMELLDYHTEKRSVRSELGQFSRVWTFEKESTRYVVGFDYPFLSWHWLENCYIGQGWELMDRTIVNDLEREDWNCVSVVLRKPAGSYGYLVYSLFDQRGRPVPPAYLSHSVRDALVNRIGRSTADELSTTYQSQVFVESAVPWTEDQRPHLIALHTRIRQRMREAVAQSTSDGAAIEGEGNHVP